MKNANVFWGAFVMLIGGLFLLNTLSIFQINVWGLIWPGILITGGLWLIWVSRPGNTATTFEPVSIPLDGKANARIKIQHGGGQISVTSAASNDDVLISGKQSGGLNYAVVHSADSLSVTLRSPAKSPTVFVPWLWGARKWELKLNHQIPLSLEIGSGASDMRLDLSGLRVTELKLETGVSATDLIFPAGAGVTDARIAGGVTSLDMRIPEGVAARIQLDGGLNATTIDQSRFPKSNGVYQSEDYDTAENKINIDLEVGVGNINIH